MKYVGMYTQQVRNNSKSLLLLFLFPCIILGVVYAFFLVMYAIENEGVISGTGEMNTTPKIVTDSRELSWLQEEKLYGKVAVEEDNRLHVRIYV